MRILSRFRRGATKPDPELVARIQAESRDKERLAEEWVQSKLEQGDFSALVAVHGGDDYQRSVAAGNALRENLTMAVTAIIEHFESRGFDPSVGSPSSSFLFMLRSADDPRAVPTLEKLLRTEPDTLGRWRERVEELVASFNPEVREQVERAARAEAERLEEARAEVRQYDEGQMLSALRMLCDAYSTGDDAAVGRLETIATAIGERLDRAGGIGEMRRVWNRLQNVPGARTLDMHWGGIGDWQG